MVIKYHVKKPIGFATLMLCFLLLACVSATLAAEEDHAVKAAPWMIAGAVAAFDDSDAKVKALALNKLMGINATAALKNRIAEIAKLLEHQDKQVRLSAVRALEKMGDAARPYMADIFRVIVTSRFYENRENIDNLVTMGGELKTVDPVVVAQLKGDHVPVNLLRSLAMIGNMAAVYAPNIAVLLRDENSTAANIAITALAGLGQAGRPYFSEVSALLRHKDAKVRNVTAEAVGRAGVGAGMYAGVMAELLKDSDAKVRNAAITALARMGEAGQPYATKINAWLRSEDADVRHSTLGALGEAGEAAGGAYAGAIAALLSDKDEGVREDAIHSLVKMGKAGGTFSKQIASLLTDRNPNMRMRAVDALGEMGGVTYTPEIAALLKDHDANVRSSALEAMGKMGEAADSYVQEVAALTGDAELGSSAMDVLTGMSLASKRKAAPMMIKYAKDQNSDIRSQAVLLLAQTGKHDNAYVASIARALKDKDPLVRYDAAGILGEIGENADSYAAAIAKLLKNDVGPNQTTVIRALGHMGAAGKAQAHNIAELLLLKNDDYYRGHDFPGYVLRDGVHADVVEGLAGMGRFEMHDAVFKVLNAKGGSPGGFAKRRFLTHFLSGGKL